MQIIHRVMLNSEEARKFAGLGIAMVRINPGSKLTDLLQFTMAEDDPRWKKTQTLIKELGVHDWVDTRFTAKELSGAQYLQMLPSWHYGYPQPEVDFQYLGITYELSQYCRDCGIGAKQLDSFRMQRPPAWGTKSILQLNWIFDEYFVRPEIWQKIFEPFGIKCRTVLHQRTGKELDSVVQLDIPDRVELAMDGFPPTQCSTCSRRGYDRNRAGFTPSPCPTNLHMFKSAQWLGVGRVQADQMVIVSQAIYRRIQAEKIRGAEFAACLPPQ